MAKEKTMTEKEVSNLVDAALDNAQSNPCLICVQKSVCKRTYKGVCKVARGIRARIATAGKARKVREVKERYGV